MKYTVNTDKGPVDIDILVPATHNLMATLQRNGQVIMLNEPLRNYVSHAKSASIATQSDGSVWVRFFTRDPEFQYLPISSTEVRSFIRIPDELRLKMVELMTEGVSYELNAVDNYFEWSRLSIPRV